MRKATILVVVTMTAVLIAAFTLLAQSQESLYGTWRANAAKSKYSPGPVPKSNIAKWEAFQGGVKLTVDVVPATGDTQHYEAISKKGGKTTLTARIVVAADGKTRITTQTGKDGQGQTVNNSIFYEKQ